MKKNYTLPVTYFKEGNQFIAYAPALDLSTCGKTIEEARRRFGEASRLFFAELRRMGTLEETLLNLGWQKHETSLLPPMVVGSENQTVLVSA